MVFIYFICIVSLQLDSEREKSTNHKLMLDLKHLIKVGHWYLEIHLKNQSTLYCFASTVILVTGIKISMSSW